MNCIHCQSEAIVKNGTKTLETGQVLQQYLCNTCGRRFNERSGTPMARLRTPVTTVEMALNARHEGLGIRAVARVVGTSPSNITTWEERLSSHLPAWFPPAPEGGEFTTEGDELYTRVGENRIPSGKATPTAELTTKPYPPKPRRAGPLVSLNARVATG
jgi:transposase-like protein